MSSDLTVQELGEGSPQSPTEPSDPAELREEMGLYVEHATEKLMELLSLTEAAAHRVQSISEQCSQKTRFLRAWLLFIRSGRGVKEPPVSNAMQEEGGGAAQ